MLFKNLSTQKVWEVINPDRIEELRASSEYQEIKEKDKKEAKKEPEETKSEEPKTTDKKSKAKAQ